MLNRLGRETGNRGNPNAHKSAGLATLGALASRDGRQTNNKLHDAYLKGDSWRCPSKRSPTGAHEKLYGNSLTHWRCKWCRTGDQLFRSTRGREVRDLASSPDDYLGHGIIRVFYSNLKGGVDKECSDFSHPKRFPVPIRLALFTGEMKGFPFPTRLLCKPLDEDYWAKRILLAEDYEAKRMLLAEDYRAKCKLLDEDYWVKRKPLDEDYWELVKNPQNRAQAWTQKEGDNG